MRASSYFAPVALAAAVLAPAAAQAHTYLYEGTLSGLNESPTNTSAGSGSVTVTVDVDLFTMRVEASFTGLNGNTTASHIHCCTDSPGVGNKGVATMTPSFVNFPTGVQSGSYDQTFDMAVAGSYNATFITNNGGTVSTAFTALFNGLNSGNAYLNIHTSFAPGGELRANLAPVPEPEGYALMLAGLATLAASVRRRNRQR
jgi:hypothetical protein